MRSSQAARARQRTMKQGLSRSPEPQKKRIQDLIKKLEAGQDINQS